MLQLINKVVTIPVISGQTQTTTHQTRTYINNGDMLDSKFVTDKFNYYRTDKKIKLHYINTSPNEYVNLGDWVEAEEINHVINDMP